MPGSRGAPARRTGAGFPCLGTRGSSWGAFREFRTKEALQSFQDATRHCKATPAPDSAAVFCQLADVGKTLFLCQPEAPSRVTKVLQAAFHCSTHAAMQHPACLWRGDRK